MRYAILAILVSSLIIGGLRFLPTTGQAASINESGLPEEADFCSILFTSTSPLNAGEAFQVAGSIFEAGVTEGAGQGAGISADVGFGPINSDPRFDAGWTYVPAVFDEALSPLANEDGYEGFITAPSPVTTTDYAVTIRFATDGSTGDHTYCDFDGAGSNLGADFDPDQLGVMTVTGAGGGGGGGSEGSVETSVDVISDPGACIILDTNAVTYGQETFSTQNAAQLGLAQVTITSCSLTTSLDLLAKGTNATGPTANWALTDAPGSGNMCDTGNAGVDEYGQRVQTNEGTQGTELALGNRTYLTGLAQGVSQPTDLLLRMPCIGSSGTGETVTSTITFTAIPGAPPVGNPCVETIFFLDIGTAQGDNSGCQREAGELFPSCMPLPGGTHSQYHAFELQDGEVGTVTVDAPWDAIVALYAIDPNTNDVFEVNCSDVEISGPETVSGVNTFGAPAFYVVQVDGLDDTQFGAYDITLFIDGGVDNDGDGYSPPGDCDDSDPSINPGAAEVIDGIDNNCNGLVDEDLTDADGDGFPAFQDCDDTNASINPGAPEIVGDDIDNNCDGFVDEGAFNSCSVMPVGLSVGTAMVDNGFCTTAAGEPIATCAGPGAGHNQYFTFTLAPGESATVTVDSAWDAVLAIYDEGLTELDCSDVSFGGASEVVSVSNASGASVNYFVQVDGFDSGEFGSYNITLAIN